ncbi:MAG: very short patch repair endonuclease [Prevotellaceae bacterium]|jgi:DNA mismatch endonuclease (patch repair protein)|nr:very short patch repair endonuclease [Prevotellaceae bacterium]
MPDQFDSQKRSEIMSKVHGSNTTPEKIVCSVLEEIGYDFSLQANELPGKPDMFLPDYNTVVFVHGCFWHGCPICRHAKIRPQENVEYWNKKLDRTLERDKENIKKLEELGYKILVIWECETKKKRIELLKKKIIEFFK